jgi:hypothetical protein
LDHFRKKPIYITTCHKPLLLLAVERKISHADLRAEMFDMLARSRSLGNRTIGQYAGKIQRNLQEKPTH